MRREANLYAGTALVLERPEELAKLRKDEAALVGPALRGLFHAYPRSFRTLAEETAFLPLATWLRRMAKAGVCELVIDRPSRSYARQGVGHSVSLRVGVGDAAVRLSGPIARVPKRCPSPLAEVLRRVGLVTLQYGAAGGLLAPKEQRSLTSLYAEIVESWRPSGARDDGVDREALQREIYKASVALGVFDASLGYDAYAAMVLAASAAAAREAATLPRPAAPKAYFAFFQDACGSYVTTNPTGATWYVPMGGGDYVAGPPIERWLARFFRPGFVWT